MLLRYVVTIFSIFLQNIFEIMHFSINEEFSIFPWCSDSASPGKELQDVSSNQRFHNTVLRKACCTRATG